MFLLPWLTLTMGAPDLPEAPEGRDPHPSDAAVVIGIESYFALPDALGAEADARAVQDVLVRSRGVPQDRLTFLTEGASRERILEAAKEAGERTGAGGTVWLYFAGHGVVRDGVHLVGGDAQPTEGHFLSRSVSLEELARLLRAGGGRPVLWIDAGFGPQGRAERRLKAPVSGTAGLSTAPGGAILWATPHLDGAEPSTLGPHGAFTYLSVGALHGWADGHGEHPLDGVVTPREAQDWVASTCATMDLPPPVLLGDTTGLAWSTGVSATSPSLSANDARAADALADGAASGPPDVAASAGDILADARGSLRKVAVGLGGDISTTHDPFSSGRVTGQAEEAALAPVLAEHLDAILPASVVSATFAAYTSRPPLSARTVTVNVDVHWQGATTPVLVEGVALPASVNWPMTAEQIGRRVLDQLEEEVPSGRAEPK